MTFLSGAALWLLGLAALVTVIYFLKKQARLQQVSALFLWQQMDQRPRSALRFQWTQLLSLILQLVALAALVVGLAEPIIYSVSGGVERLAIVIDGSASMRALTGTDGTTRYQQGLKAVERLLIENPAAEATVIQAQTQSAILAAPTENHSLIRKALQEAAPSYQGDARWSDLVSLVQSNTGQEYERVVFITDHTPSAPVEIFGWEVEQVGGAGEPNIALTDFLVREQPGAAGYDFFLSAYNSTTEIVEVPFVIYADNQVVREDKLQIPPQGEITRSISTVLRHADRFSASLLTSGLANIWADDDVRYATSPRPQPWKILWVGTSNFYLESFLSNSGEAELTHVEMWDEAANPPDAYDLVILNQVTLPTSRSGSYLVIGGSFGSWVELQSTREVDGGQIGVESNHSLLQGMDPTAWRLLSMPEVAVSSQGHVLLSAESFPFLYVLEKPGLKLAYVAADLEQSNLVLSIDFPILVYRLLTWLAPRAGQSTTMLAGQELPLSVLEAITTVLDPAGRMCNFDPDKGSSCGHVDKPGFYEAWRENGDSFLFAVNPEPNESRWGGLNTGSLADNNSTSTGNTTTAPTAIADAARELKAALPIWPYLLGFGILLLIIELLMFHKSFLPNVQIQRRRAQ